jgi:predicted Zn-dependent protease
MLETRIRDLLCAARDEARRKGIQAEFLFWRERASLIRLAASAVALSTYEDLSRLDIEVFEGRRKGAYGLTEDITSLDQLRSALDKALAKCRASLELEYQPIFGRIEKTIDDDTGFDPAMDRLAPEAKADVCARVVSAIKPRGNYDFSGSWTSGTTEVYFTTTANDNEAYRRLTDSTLQFVLKEQAKRWETWVQRTARTAAGIDARDFIGEFEQLLPVYEKNQPYRPELGKHRVMFGPDAVATIITMGTYIGFAARGWEEKQSFTADRKPGDRVFASPVTLRDDPFHPDVFRMSFDTKGFARKPYVIVENGIMRGLLYDSLTAAKYGKAQTGHENGPADLVLDPGQGPAGLEAGRKLAGNALYIPQLHYVHIPDYSKGQLTASSRFNAMRIQDGEFTAPLLSSRMLDTVPNLFSNVVAMSSKSVLMDTSSSYDRRFPRARGVPEYVICDNVHINDVAESF